MLGSFMSQVSAGGSCPLTVLGLLGSWLRTPGWGYRTVQNYPASQRQQTKFCESSNSLFIQDKKNNDIKKVTETEQFFRGSFNSVAALMIPLV